MFPPFPYDRKCSLGVLYRDCSDLGGRAGGKVICVSTDWVEVINLKTIFQHFKNEFIIYIHMIMILSNILKDCFIISLFFIIKIVTIFNNSQG